MLSEKVREICNWQEIQTGGEKLVSGGIFVYDNKIFLNFDVDSNYPNIHG